MKKPLRGAPRDKVRDGGRFDPDRAIRTWEQDGIAYFKVAEVSLPVTSSAAALERAARAAGRDVEAEAYYAWDLGAESSTAWWFGWGGFDLEEEIVAHAVRGLKPVREKLAAFDPKDNDVGCDSVEEYLDLLVAAHDTELSAADLKRGFRDWVNALSPEIRHILERDLASWYRRAANTAPDRGGR
ncbi:hypothetical protein [Oceanibacterium hippocampi]|uniref:Uncharacterized protein n=1 Tax=Oceanibacterium hippocampi TaxID=745714 RepID=A0A1Y5S4L2_9PROT|nr:hypothetical protein [Oceanibacterium hippocampi]SLN32471.1 hypothetical protein OCH7691_01205 [Oceanibacterium hippocampi]